MAECQSCIPPPSLIPSRNKSNQIIPISCHTVEISIESISRHFRQRKENFRLQLHFVISQTVLHCEEVLSHPSFIQFCQKKYSPPSKGGTCSVCVCQQSNVQSFQISFLKFYVTVDANKSSSSFSFGENLVKVAPNANKLLKTSHYPHFILMDFLIIFQQYTRLLAVYLGSLLKMKSLPIRHSSEGGSKSENTFLCS